MPQGLRLNLFSQIDSCGRASHAHHSCGGPFPLEATTSYMLLSLFLGLGLPAVLHDPPLQTAGASTPASWVISCASR
jgi:hypothetical protein